MLTISKYTYISFDNLLLFVNSEKTFCISNVNFSYPFCKSYVVNEVTVVNTKLKIKAGIIILHEEWMLIKIKE